MKDTLSFTTALITGGAGGLGYAMASYLLTLNKTVILAGRTESKLQDASKTLSQHPSNKSGKQIPYYVFDTGDVKAIPEFVEKVTKEHPELDCVINNAGVQRPLRVEEFDLGKADQEIDINIRGPMHLAIAFLPHLKSHQDGGVIVNVSSVLGYNPFSIINPVYNGTKAWVHFFTMNLRTQLSNSSDTSLNKIRVVEIVPPTVATDLHRERENPDDNKKENNKSALSVEEFIEQISEQWKEGKEVLPAGMGKEIVKKWYEAYGEGYEQAAKGGK